MANGDVWKDLESDPVYSQFLSDDFDVKIHASQILQGVVVSEQLAKLAEGISTLDKELHQQVSEHYEDLLSQATGIEKLEGVLTMMQTHIQCLLSAVERLRSKIVEPFNRIQNQTLMLSRLQATCDLLRRIIRILHLSKRLHTQLQGGISEITKAAQSLNELDHLSRDVDLSGLEVIEKDQRLIRQARAEVEKQAERMLVRGMDVHNQTQVGTALQVFYNLGTLEATIDKVLKSAINNIQKQVKEAVDVQILTQPAQDVHKTRVPGRAVMPNPGSTANFRALLWTNMEKLMDQIYTSCSQVAHLQKVLAKKRDPVTHVCFLEHLNEKENSQLMHHFWNSVTKILLEEFGKAAEESTFIKQAFEGEYPKFLRLYCELWKRLQQFSHSLSKSGSADIIVAVETIDIGDKEEDIFLNNRNDFQSEQALRNTLVPFENAYLARSLSRLFDPINLMFSDSEAVPSQEEVDGIIRVISSELNISLVDVLLSKTVAKNIAQTVHLFCAKCENLVVTDGEASQVIGPPTAGQTLNAATVNLLFYFEKQMWKTISNFSTLPETAVICIKEAMKKVEMQMRNAIQPLLISVGDAIEAIILTMHNEDFSGSATEGKPDAPCSLYMRELQGFLSRVASDYLSQFKCRDFITNSVHPLACRCLELFVRHASLIRPLGEGGKMRLAADFAQMEMAVTPLCPRAGDLGKPYRVLRSFRPFLFQTPDHIIDSPALGEVIPYSTVLHFLFSRAPPELRSPQQTANWSVSRYSQWLDEHCSEKDRLQLIKGALQSYVQSIRQRQGKEFAGVYPVMVTLLQKGLASVS